MILNDFKRGETMDSVNRLKNKIIPGSNNKPENKAIKDKEFRDIIDDKLEIDDVQLAYDELKETYHSRKNSCFKNRLIDKVSNIDEKTLTSASCIGVGAATPLVAAKIGLIGSVAPALAVGIVSGIALAKILNTPAEKLNPLNKKTEPSTEQPQVFNPETEPTRGISSLLSPEVKEQVDEVTGSTIIEGNRVTLLNNGPEAFSKKFELIENAQTSINLQTFVFIDDKAGWETARLLAKKSNEGVKCRFIYDKILSAKNSDIFDYMKENGVEVHGLDYVSLKSPLTANKRWHQKILTTDNKHLVTGGMNIGSDYALNGTPFLDFSHGANGFTCAWMKDHGVHAEGPVVDEAIKTFAENWELIGGKNPEMITSENPPAEKVDDTCTRWLSSNPSIDNESNIENWYKEMLSNAEETAYIKNAYFAPKSSMIKQLADAAERGVDVRIITNSAETCNVFPFSNLAGRKNYKKMLDSGVRIFELEPHPTGIRKTLHSKTAVFDGQTSNIGSFNLTTRSSDHDTENALIIYGKETGEEMLQEFGNTLEKTREVTKEELTTETPVDHFAQWFFGNVIKDFI
jgi:cardiolipin synthase A/B